VLLKCDRDVTAGAPAIATDAYLNRRCQTFSQIKSNIIGTSELNQIIRRRALSGAHSSPTTVSSAVRAKRGFDSSFIDNVVSVRGSVRMWCKHFRH
jgi:hypothetical protein